MDLINKKKLDEAEKAANRLLKEYPDQIDGFDRLAEVYEARGDNKKSANFAKENEGFESETIDWYLSRADRVLNKE